MTKQCPKINIYINEETVSIDEATSLAQVLKFWLKTGASLQPKAESFVIALNQNFVPRSLYDQTLLKTGDTIELLSPMAGG
jgi:sulfur carrier protein